MTRPADLEQIDHLVARFYDAFDNRRGRAPSLEAIAALLVPGAIIVRDAGGLCETFDVAAFARPRIALLTKGDLVDFHEWETEASTRIVGAVADRTSTYQKRGLLHGEPYSGGGRKLFQLARFEDGWRITAIAWSDDA